MGVHPVHEALTSQYVQDLLRIKARQLRRRMEFKGEDPDEIQTELTIHVLQRAHLFDPARGAIATFVAQVVDTGAAMMCRDRLRFKRGTGARPQSLEGSIVQHEGQAMSMLEMLLQSDLDRHRGAETVDDLDRSQFSSELRGALGNLTPELQKIAGMMMEGASDSAISRNLNISRRQVVNAAQAIRRHLEKAGFTRI